MNLHELKQTIKRIIKEETSKKYVIYKVSNNKNDKIYIGQTSMDYNLRIERHKIRSKNGETNKFHRALKHHGFNNFKWRKMFETNSKKECDEQESYYIKKYNAIENGYNSTKGRKLLDDDKKLKEGTEKAVSDAQRDLFNLVVSYMKGETKKASKQVKDIASNITLKDAEKIAHTKGNLPKHK